ncbi:MAG: LysR family transcriptional regulator [Rhodospirillales bacterium]|nr:LysR family transcriptional regulator [Rhodospirillales bacterium]
MATDKSNDLIVTFKFFKLIFMHFQNFDDLRVFNVVARHGSFASATKDLNLTKGAISYRIRMLEETLGFLVFRRVPRGVVLTTEGQNLLDATEQSFLEMERRINALRSEESGTVTVGLSTYLASRWLSPRLMDFIQSHTDIRLRIQPMLDLLDLDGEGIDLAIRWGDGLWDDMIVEQLFSCPAFPTGTPEVLSTVQAIGLERAFASLSLLHDRESSHAWADWYRAAGIEYPEQSNVLTIPDPNVRVQAVADGQGIALNDDLMIQELVDGRLVRLSDIRLENYGYFLAYRPEAMSNRSVANFAKWLLNQN